MDQVLTQIYQSLQKLVGFHRQLLETIRIEHEALVQADLNSIQRTTLAKQGLIEEIRQAESERLKHTGELAANWKKSPRDLSLPNLIIAIQGSDPKGAEQLRTVFNVLTILIQRITEQNQFNLSLIEKSLVHVHQMKKNALGASGSQLITYTPQGQTVSASSPSRLLSKEV